MTVTRTDDSELFPSPEVYEQEYEHLPWGKLVRRAAECVCELAPERGVVLDYMCGTGFLLNEVAQRRTDLDLCGCTLAQTFIDYGKNKYRTVKLEHADAMSYRPTEEVAVVVCTGGLHHLREDKQPAFVHKVANELAADGWFVLGEVLLGDYRDNRERALAAVELGTAVFEYAVKTGAPDSVTNCALELLRNDIFRDGEYKRCRRDITAMLDDWFIVDAIEQTWPNSGERYGEFLFRCRRR